LDASLPNVVDLPDGSFELRPDPRQVRKLRRFIGAYGVFSIGIWAAVVAWILTQPRRIPWPLLAIPFVVSIAVELILWYGVRPPVLKADAMDIRSVAPLFGERMPRSDLAMIFRGQVLVRSRHSSWVKTYLFVGRDGKIGVRPGPASRLRASPSLRSGLACRCVGTSARR
jgi:hypothetical protein